MVKTRGGNRGKLNIRSTLAQSPVPVPVPKDIEEERESHETEEREQSPAQSPVPVPKDIEEEGESDQREQSPVEESVARSEERKESDGEESASEEGRDDGEGSGSEEGGEESEDGEGSGSEEGGEDGEGNEEDIEEESDRSLPPLVNRNEEEGERDEESTSRTVTASTGSEEETETPLQPLRMYFPPSEYKKKIKLSTRCFINEALKTLDALPHPLTRVERKWFEEHPQFQHIFHMPRDKNHKVMGMWMLLLRTASIEKEKEAWFVVNGTPIRYSLKEHALISGLNCRNYPLHYNKAGSEAFVSKHFKGLKTIRYQDVKAKLEAMVPRERSQERLKMAVLYFLSSIVIAQTKTGEDATPVEAFFLRAVDDLNFCKKFPWGRLSFDHMLKEIKHTMTHFGGAVKEGVLWPVPGFCIPMELLAFEAIPELGDKFREDYPGADANCPRMCRRRWKKGDSKGFPLSKINKELGTTVDIDSILVVRDGENSLLAEITEKDDDDDKHDVVVNSWMHRLSKGHTVSFEEMYNQDVASRLGGEEPVDAVNEEIAANERSGNPTMAEMVDLVNTMKKEMEEQRKETAEMVDGFGRRLASLEALVKEQVRQASADPSEEDIDDSTEPPNNQSGPFPQPPNELVGSSHDQGNDMNKRKSVKRTGVDENPSRRVTRSKKNVE